MRRELGVVRDWRRVEELAHWVAGSALAHVLAYPGSVEIVGGTRTALPLRPFDLAPPRPGATVFVEDPATLAPSIHGQALAT